MVSGGNLRLCPDRLRNRSQVLRPRFEPRTYRIRNGSDKPHDSDVYESLGGHIWFVWPPIDGTTNDLEHPFGWCNRFWKVRDTNLKKALLTFLSQISLRANEPFSNYYVADLVCSVKCMIVLLFILLFSPSKILSYLTQQYSEVFGASETLVNLLYCNPEDGHIWTHHRVNLESYRFNYQQKYYKISVLQSCFWRMS